jgi:hypothetical protein
MSRKGQSKNFTNTLSLLIIIGLFIAGFSAVYFSTNKAETSLSIWQHFSDLSLIVAGYFFGKRSKKANKLLNRDS